MRLSISTALVALLVFAGCATDSSDTAPVDASADTESVAGAEGTETVDAAASCEPERDQDVPSPGACASVALGSAAVEIQYSSPRVKGREIFGGLVPYGEVWRTGANEATVLTTDAPLTIGGETLPAGSYGVFTIPGETEWTIIFNSVADQWGGFEYDESQDVLRTVATPAATDAPQEEFLITFEDASDADATMVLAWNGTRVPVHLSASSS